MKLPPFVHGFLTRHGKPIFYLRRKGFRKVRLPGLPWSAQFMKSYEAALAGQPAIEPGRGKISPGSMRALAISYFASPAFTLLAPTTRGNYRRAIERFCAQHGERVVNEMQRQHVIKLLAALADRPQAANQLRMMLRLLMAHAVEIGMRADDPTRDIKRVRGKSHSHHPWTETEIAQFESRWPIGTRERLAMALLLYTGQRSGDVRRMGEQHVEAGSIRVRQEKTRNELLVPIHPDLQAVLAGTVRGHLIFIINDRGTPYGAGGFGDWFKLACRRARLDHCNAHGLRHVAARRLADAGCTTHEIASITGHRSLTEVARYAAAADQKRLAVMAMSKVKRRT
jgi:integrase